MIYQLPDPLPGRPADLSETKKQVSLSQINYIVIRFSMMHSMFMKVLTLRIRMMRTYLYCLWIYSGLHKLVLPSRVLKKDQGSRDDTSDSMFLEIIMIC